MSGSFQPSLRSGERLLWQGAPHQGVLFRKADFFLVPFSLLWGGFALFWESSVIVIGLAHPNPQTSFMMLWGVPFVLIGLYLILGRFLIDAWVRAGVRYVLTDERALIERTRFGYALSSIELRGKPVRLSGLRKDGSGTIDLGETSSAQFMSTRSAGGLWMPWLAGSSFEGITEVRSVFRQVEEVARRR